MLRQYCFLNASVTKISSHHSLKAGSITTQHLMEATTLKLSSPHITNHHITNRNLMDGTIMTQYNFTAGMWLKKH